MRVFFASCTAEDDTDQDARINAVQIILSEQKHTVFMYTYDHRSTDAHANLSFTMLAENILRCDVFIAEMSLPSQTLGFQIAFALSSGKPCLYLYSKGKKARPDAPIANHPSRLMKFSDYTSHNLENRITKFIEYARKQMTTKRISFMSTDGIDQYLADASRRLGTPKSELIRTALHKAAEQSRST